MLLNPTPTPLSTFTYFRSQNELVTEESSLPNRARPFGRVWDDACDEGLTVVSPTGRSVVYVVAGVERNREGELLLTRLAPALDADHALPTVVVFND